MNRHFLHKLIKLSISAAAGSILLISGLGTSPARIAHASSNVITVNSLSDVAATCASNGNSCLRNAIAIASNYGTPTTINFSVSGTITLSSTLTINNNQLNPITIDGIGQSIALDGGSTGPNDGAPIMIIGDGAALTVHSVTFKNGNAYAGNGGAISNAGSLNISSSLLLSNTAAYAGAIYNSGTLFVNSDTFSSNTATTYNTNNVSGGGALGIISGTVSINNSFFSYNTATSVSSAVGGAIAIADGVVTVNNSTFSGNSSTSIGGAISLTNSTGSLTINNSTLSGNSSGTLGGAIENSSTVSISNSTLSGNIVNHVTGSGGAILNYSTGTMTISNSTFSGNSAAYGGAIDNAGLLTIGNNTFAENEGFYKGGAINGDNGNTLYAFSNIISGNTATQAGADVYAVVISLGYNLVGNASGSTGFTNPSDQTGVNANLGNLAYNGGVTKTYSLAASSPAFGTGNCAGNSSVTPHVPPVYFDQRAVTRKNPNGSGAGCDIGAFDLSNTDTIGIYRNGTFYLRLHNSTGIADLTVSFHPGSKPYPIVGDWLGAGWDTVGVYDQGNGSFILCTSNNTATCATPAVQKTFTLGNPNDTPLAGRWKFNTSNSGVGVFRPSNGILYMKHNLNTGYADYSEVLGIPGDKGLAGDWTDKGYDSPGVYRPAGSLFYLSNKVTNGSVYADLAMTYGLGGDAPVVGDWISQGHDGIGLFRQSNGFTYLKNGLTTGYADLTFTYGIAGDIPVAGHWQGTYPPAPAAHHPTAPSILIPRTPMPQATQGSGSVGGSNLIGD